MTVCRSCGEPILWAVTSTGSRIPIDFEPVSDGNVQLNENGSCVMAGKGKALTGPLRKTHYATCPDAAAWRKRPNKQKG